MNKKAQEYKFSQKQMNLMAENINYYHEAIQENRPYQDNPAESCRFCAADDLAVDKKDCEVCPLSLRENGGGCSEHKTYIDYDDRYTAPKSDLKKRMNYLIKACNYAGIEIYFE